MPQPTPAFDMHRIAPAPHGLPTRRQALATGAAALAAAAWGLPRVARAQGDGKPLRVILPLSAGSGADGAISTSLAKALGQPIVIENLPGAGGITGTTQIVRAYEPARRLFAAAQVPFRDGMPGAVSSG